MEHEHCFLVVLFAIPNNINLLQYMTISGWECLSSCKIRHISGSSCTLTNNTSNLAPAAKAMLNFLEGANNVDDVIKPDGFSILGEPPKKETFSDVAHFS